MDKLNNDKKFLSEADDGAEFEIPDTPILGEFTEEDEGKAAAEHELTDGNITDNDADTSSALKEPEGGENATVDEAATEDKAEADTEDKADTVPDTEREDEAEADTAEPDMAEAAEPAVGEESAVYTTNESNSFPADAPSDGAKPASEEFETDAEGRRIVPEGYIPDNALYVPVTEPAEDGAFIDLLGDPMEDTLSEDSDEQSELDPDIIPMSAEAEEKLPTEEKYDPEKPRRIDTIFDFIELLIFTLVAVLFVTSFFFKHAVVDGPSMLETLEHGDVLIISDIFYDPEPGDIVVFEDYSLRKENYRKPIVKRVIAVEGQRVTVKRDGIYVSYSDDPSEPLYEPYVYTSSDNYKYDIKNVCDELAALESFGRNSEAYWFIVPEGEVFVLGDHRDDSTDSRTLGTIRTDAVLGKVLFRVYPFDKLGKVDASFNYDEK